jgi:hypothetical protein
MTTMQHGTEINGRLYAWCRACASVVYRIPGYQHGDGQLDSDECQVWLLDDTADWSEADDVAKLPEIECGCNA